MAYWVALALHLGTPQVDGYAKLVSLKVPEWFASAEARTRTDSKSKLQKLEHAPPEASTPYEKLSSLKAY